MIFRKISYIRIVNETYTPKILTRFSVNTSASLGNKAFQNSLFNWNQTGKEFLF